MCRQYSFTLIAKKRYEHFRHKINIHLNKDTIVATVIVWSVIIIEICTQNISIKGRLFKRQD